HPIVPVVVNDWSATSRLLDLHSCWSAFWAQGPNNIENIGKVSLESRHHTRATHQDVPGHRIVDFQRLLSNIEEGADLYVVRMRHDTGALVGTVVIDHHLVEPSRLYLHHLDTHRVQDFIAGELPG